MLLLVPAALLVLSTGSAQATPAARAGSPGEVTTTFGPKSDDVAQALVLQRDGKIVVVGYRSPGGEASEFALARYRPNGTLDTSFGTGGKVTTAFGFANAAALEPGGRIVAVGGILVNRPDFDFALARYTASGALDSSFGSGGKVTTTFGPTADIAQALTLQPDGRIVVAGSSGFPQQRDDAFALARYDAQGALDSGFGAGGRVTTRFTSPGDDTARAVVLQPDGKIVAVGSNFVAAREGPSDFALARYDAKGVLDRSFGSGGKVTTTFGTGSDFANAGVLQPDGKLVAAGYTYVGGVAGRSYFALARYGVDGSLDESFGSGGRVTTDFGPGGGTAWAVALQRDGKIVAAGNGPEGTFALARYNANGSLDQGFGSGGTVTTRVGLRDEGQAAAVAQLPEGKVVAAGWSVSCTYLDFDLTFYTPNGAPDPSVGSSGKRCIVPDVRRKKLAAARAAIMRRGCTVGPTGREFSRTVKRGYVIGQFPRGGAECQAGQKVVLSVSKGKRPRP